MGSFCLSAFGALWLRVAAPPLLRVAIFELMRRTDIPPVVSINEAVDIANDSPYGLSGGVWGADADEATAVARRLRTGGVEVNGGSYNPLAPFGGYKQSGIGRDKSLHAMDKYCQVKNTFIQL